MDQDRSRVVPDHRIGKRFGDYLLEDQIGRGGMGVVFRARHEVSGDIVALKLMAPDLAHNETFRERFIAEAEATPNLSHPNIVPVFESGEADGELFIAMELIEGTDLKGLIKQEGRLDPKRVLTIFRQAASALDAAHEAGMVHRDVKPQNILVVPRETPTGVDRVYLTDFGLVRPLTSETTASRTGQVFGSVAYMAPELIEGIPADGRADVYALGCVLYECLTGVVPFERENEVSTVWAHIHEDPPLLTDTSRDLPGGLNDVVFKAMSKHPDDRYLTCGEFVNELELGLGRKLSHLKYAHVRPLVARVPRRKTEREVWAPNFFPELSRVRAASRERFDWRKAAALVAAVLALSTVQVGREGGIPQAVADVAEVAGSVGPRVVRALAPDEEEPREREESDRSSMLVTKEPMNKGDRPGERSTGSLPTGSTTVAQRGTGETSPTDRGAAISEEQGGGQIAYVSNADGDFDIYLMDLSSGDSTKLTHNQLDDWDPSWSPDGERIVFATGPSMLQGNSDLAIMRWDGSDRRSLTSSPYPETFPSWASRGRIAFMRILPRSAGALQTPSVRVTDPSGFTESLIREPGISPAWSPDGKAIAFSNSGEGGPQRIWTMRADGSKAAALTEGREDGFEISPQWSPDGKMIAFTSSGEQSVTVGLTDLNGSTTTLTAGSSPAWSPDGRRLAFVRDSDLWLINRDGSEAALLAVGATAADLLTSPAWRPQING